MDRGKDFLGDGDCLPPPDGLTVLIDLERDRKFGELSRGLRGLLREYVSDRDGSERIRRADEYVAKNGFPISAEDLPQAVYQRVDAILRKHASGFINDITAVRQIPKPDGSVTFRVAGIHSEGTDVPKNPNRTFWMEVTVCNGAIEENTPYEGSS